MMHSMIDEVARTGRFWISCAQLAQDANSVVAMRLWGQAGTWTVPRSEGAQMVREKHTAFTAAMLAAGYAAMEGQSGTNVADAALAPLSETARDNRARLARMGPRVWPLEAAENPITTE